MRSFKLHVKAVKKTNKTTDGRRCKTFFVAVHPSVFRSTLAYKTMGLVQRMACGAMLTHSVFTRALIDKKKYTFLLYVILN